MKKKRKKQFNQRLSLIGLGMVVLMAVFAALAVWSVWYGYHNPQTGFQHLASLATPNALKGKSAAEVVFLGDSITARQEWDGLLGVNNIVNAGISGNTTNDVLSRLEPLLKEKPQKLFVMVGINDLAKGKDVFYVLANYETIIKKIKAGSPKTAIYIESVLPVDGELSPIGKVDSQNIVVLNIGLRSLAEQEGAVFIDLYPKFVVPGNKMNAKYASDGVHPNANGYALMKVLLEPYVK